MENKILRLVEKNRVFELFTNENGEKCVRCKLQFLVQPRDPNYIGYLNPLIHIGYVEVGNGIEVEAVATCRKGDTYDEGFGKHLALISAQAKALNDMEEFCYKIVEKLNTATSLFEKETQRYGFAKKDKIEHAMNFVEEKYGI